MSPGQQAGDPAPRPAATLERWLWIATLTALTTALLHLVAWADAGGDSEVRLVLWFLPWLLLLHGVVALTFLGMTAALGKLRRSSLEARARKAYGLAVVGIAITLNGDILVLIPHSEHPLLLTSGLVVCATTILIAAGAIPARPQARRGMGVASVALFAISLLPIGGGAPAPDPPPASNYPGSGQRLLLIGLDGADWQFIEALIARGELPNLRRLRDNGAWGPLATLRPTVSPLIWTSIATGRVPTAHGVNSHLVSRPRGGYDRIPRKSEQVRGLGAKGLLRFFERTGRVVASPPTSAERLVPAFWNIASHFGSPISVINWWATWPAEPVLGRIVTDRAYFWRWAARGAPPVSRQVTFPAELYADLQSSLVRPQDVRLSDARRFMDIDRPEFDRMMALPYDHHRLEAEFKYYYSMFTSHRRIAMYLLESDRDRGLVPADLLVLLRIIDYASHSSLKYSDLVEEHLNASEEAMERYGTVVSEAYRQADEALGELIRGFGPGNVIVLSDHGFRLESWAEVKKDRVAEAPQEKINQWRRTFKYNHDLAPDGIFIASGPAFRPGRVEELTVLDILPLLLQLKGWPVADEFEGRLAPEVFTGEFLEGNIVPTIPSYWGLHRRIDHRTDEATDEQMIERLRALGYVD